jgi:thimet oligopeptidase
MRCLFKSYFAALLLAALLLAALFVGCADTRNTAETPSREPIKVLYQAGEIKAASDEAFKKAEEELSALAQLPAADRADIQKSLLTFERILGDLDARVLVLTAIGDVATDAAVREESFTCYEAYGSFTKKLYTRKELYEAVKEAAPGNDDEARLLDHHRKRFEKSGLALDDEKRTELTTALSTLSNRETQFNKNIADDQTSVQFTAAELQGVPQGYLDGFSKTADGAKYIVTTEYLNYAGVMTYAQNAETRRKMMLAYYQVGGQANVALLGEAVDARQEIARLVGYAHWGDYQTDGRMARTAKTAIDMQNALKTKIKPRFDADMQRMLEAKKAAVAGATQLEAWDASYYGRIIQAEEFSYDEEAIKEYFPMDVVFDGLFGICGELFGIRIEEVKDAVVWDGAVKLYALRDQESGAILGYFYVDPYPRDGKYDWFATSIFRNGRRLADGTYQKPVAMFLGNFIPRPDGQPPLLSPDDVETVFHEFGHVLHATLTKAPYTSWGLYSVAWDFVELPSQLLQFFARDKKILRRVSGHYQDKGSKIPDGLLNQIETAAAFNLGYGYLKQIWLGILDMTLHTSETKLDPTAACDTLYSDMLGMTLPNGNLFVAGFAHLMGGYDAGYYSYIWSEVYAWDVLAEFQKTDFAGAATGRRYRQTILERGAGGDPLDLVTEFLGRAPNDSAFNRWLGI